LNAGHQMMDVMIADVDGEPDQPPGQIQKTGSLDRSGVVVPVRIARKGMLEIVLYPKQYDAGAAIGNSSAKTASVPLSRWTGIPADHRSLLLPDAVG
jgi:hypothetical protein